MKVKELIAELKKYDPELDVWCFAGGDVYEPKEIKAWTENLCKVVEIGCGWSAIGDDV